VVEEIKKIKEAVRTQTGSYKYYSCYDDVIAIIKEEK